ncbi:hypothetical protein ACFL27_03145 [candidate division CSSED10-310 bacterium]|uniref:Uncharacterized protein n=1 Tax=candidate division CSSED10-310 bacterium TaxID=2855610 RepID=A0ABV6YSK6_UNCC1
MSIVNALRLSRNSGAIISDEETWLFGRRRLFISDSIASLLSAEMAEKLQMEVIFAGIGNISLTCEVIKNVKYDLQIAFDTCEHISEFKFNSINKIATLCNHKFQEAIKRRINNILQFRYGFDLTSFHRGYVEHQGQKIEIKQKNVLDDCLAIIEPSQVGPFLQPIYENEALIAGWDQKNCYQIYEIDAQSQEKFLSPSAYCNLGRGADTGAIVLADLVNSRTLQQRRQGFDKIEGLIELIYSANVTSTFNNQVGGYFTIVLIDGEETDPSRRLIEITDHEARLTNDIVTALKAGLLQYDQGCELVRKIVEMKAPATEIEKQLFNSVQHPRHLDLLLRGYKVQAINQVYLTSSKPYPIFTHNDPVKSGPADSEIQEHDEKGGNHDRH